VTLLLACSISIVLLLTCSMSDFLDFFGRWAGFYPKSFAMTLGDVDGDGDLDVIAASAGKRMKVWLDDGTGRFTSRDSCWVWVALGVVAISAIGLCLLPMEAEAGGVRPRRWLSSGPTGGTRV
jgi:hypothetical protein